MNNQVNYSIIELFIVLDAVLDAILHALHEELHQEQHQELLIMFDVIYTEKLNISLLCNADENG